MNSNGSKPKVTMWHMFRDIFVTAMVKGQLPLLSVLFVVFIVIIKMSPEGVEVIAVDFYNSVKGLYLLGYCLWGATVFGWYFHAKYQRRQHAAEVDRLAEGKKKIQEKALARKLGSTKK
jgi:hypothetical protein